MMTAGPSLTDHRIGSLHSMNSTQRRIALLVVVLVAIVGPILWLRTHRPIDIPRAPIDNTVSAKSDSADAQDTHDAAALDPSPVAAVPAAATLEMHADALNLVGPGDGCQVCVMRQLPDGTAEDLTRTCTFQMEPEGIAEISTNGYLRAIGNGTVQLRAYLDSSETTATFTIGEAELPVSDFALDIVPILTKASCNSGQCHGSAQGKGGLQLSLFGYDPEADHASLTRGLEGRRIDPFSPTSSLILMKPTLTMPHGGGLRIRPGSSEEDRLRRWIEAGTPWHDESRGRLEKLVVEPTDRFLPSAPAEQQIQVTAEYADGVRRDVTRLCLFVTNDPSTVAVDKNGLARMLRRGQADVVVRFANKVANIRLASPFNDQVDFNFADSPRRNFIDEQVARQLEHMRLPISNRSTDAEFLRRIYYDLVGHMPDPDSRDDAHFVEDFLADVDPNKRDKLIEKLLKHADFANFWALKFGDLLQINSSTMGTATGSYRIWLANQLRLDKSGNSMSYDTLVKTLLLASGSLKPGQLNSQSGQRVYYASPKDIGEIAEQTARRFLGLRIRCARCHDHPLDVWTQDDYYGFASFFGGVRVEAGNEPLAQEVKVVKENSVVHLRTGATPQPKFLGGPVADTADREDVRELLVEWLLEPANPRFARMAANWVWAHLMGRGLVEPVDDMRATNPPTNPALLDELAQNFRENGYDLRGLIRTICQSETYQRASTPLEANESDDKFFSHALLKPLNAYQMADAIAQVTRVPNSYGQNLGKGTRAIEINDPNLSDYLLDILGRCDRTGGCEVGALARPASLKLALHLIIGDAINAKLERRGSLVSDMGLFARERDASSRGEVTEKQIESIYLRTYCRYPSPAEMEFWVKTLAESTDPAEGLEDMVWALLNSREFAMNH
jgi:hypothetical protein